MDAEPSEPEWRAQLALSDDLIADAYARKWQVNDALAAYRAALAIREGLAMGDPGNLHWQRGIALSQTNIGDMLRRQGKWGRSARRLSGGGGDLRNVWLPPNPPTRSWSGIC